MAKISADLDEQLTNQFRNLAKIKFGKKKNFLAGYQNKALNVFIEYLKNKEIKTLVDVRRNIISKKENFSGAALDSILRRNHIVYVSLPMLVPPSEMRYELYETKDYSKFFTDFRNYLNNNINYLGVLNF